MGGFYLFFLPKFCELFLVETKLLQIFVWRDSTIEGRILPHSWINRPQEIEQELSSLWSGAMARRNHRNELTQTLPCWKDTCCFVSECQPKG